MKRQPDKWSLLFTFINNSFNLELLKGETFFKGKDFPFQHVNSSYQEQHV